MVLRQKLSGQREQKVAVGSILRTIYKIPEPALIDTKKLITPKAAERLTGNIAEKSRATTVEESCLKFETLTTTATVTQSSL